MENLEYEFYKDKELSKLKEEAQIMQNEIRRLNSEKSIITMDYAELNIKIVKRKNEIRKNFYGDKN